MQDTSAFVRFYQESKEPENLPEEFTVLCVLFSGDQGALRMTMLFVFSRHTNRNTVDVAVGAIQAAVCDMALRARPSRQYWRRYSAFKHNQHTTACDPTALRIEAENHHCALTGAPRTIISELEFHVTWEMHPGCQFQGSLTIRASVGVRLSSCAGAYDSRNGNYQLSSFAIHESLVAKAAYQTRMFVLGLRKPDVYSWVRPCEG